MKIPGVVWSTLLIFLPLLAGYITEFFSGYEWSGAVAGFLTLLGVGLAKVIAEQKASKPTITPAAQAMELSLPFPVPEGYSLIPTPKPVSQTRRILLG